MRQRHSVEYYSSLAREYQARPRYRTADIPAVETMVMDEPGIVVTRTTYAAITRYRMAGTPELVQREVDAVRKNYPVKDYGTYSHMPRFLGQGCVEVTVDRSNSCA